MFNLATIGPAGLSFGQTMVAADLGDGSIGYSGTTGGTLTPTNSIYNFSFGAQVYTLVLYSIGTSITLLLYNWSGLSRSRLKSVVIRDNSGTLLGTLKETNASYSGPSGLKLYASWTWSSTGISFSAGSTYKIGLNFA